MKIFKPFETKLNCELYPEYYTFGLEVEFWAEKKYFESVHSSSAGILGIDGAGQPTGEFRSPVFKSSTPRIAFNGAMRFTTNVLNSLVENYKVEFAPAKYRFQALTYEQLKDKLENMPFCQGCKCYHTSEYGDIYIDNRHLQFKDIWPFGIHFSLGGKFLTDGKFHALYKRANTVSELLMDRIVDKDLLAKRESFGYTSKFVENQDCNATRIKSGQSNFSNPERIKLVEFRFFPSCKFTDVIPYLRYIILDGNLPETPINSLRN